jgi:hypothetical protein
MFTFTTKRKGSYYNIFKISDMNVVITGASKGLGKAIAGSFASQGATPISLCPE